MLTLPLNKLHSQSHTDVHTQAHTQKKITQYENSTYIGNMSTTYV